MPPVLASLVPATELDAVNAVLGVIGESPLAAGTDLSTVTQGDAVAAIALLRDTSRWVQQEGWRFNTEFGYEVAPAATLAWVDTAGVTTTLNIFLPPPALASFRATPVGGLEVDAAIRPSRQYKPAGSPVPVFYDRALNRDGFDQARHPFLYIDPVWYLDFEALPDEARRYITIAAAREAASRVLGSQTLTQLTAIDEGRALRTLRRVHGEPDRLSLFNNATSARWLGGRVRGAAGVMDRRASPGPA